VVPSNPTIAFAKTALPTAVGQLFSGVTMGPDGNLYANTLTGGIFQFPMNANGTLGNPVNIAAMANFPDRLITGIAFDPSSTATHMIIWISSGDPAETNAPDFSGTIGTISISTSAMTGTVVSPYQVDVTGLPRSNSNHLNDQPVFGPDGALYWCQGSNSSMGAPDDVWGYRPEHLLNAAILRLNVQLIEQYVAANKGPLNVQTDSLPAGQTAYNPYATGAPLTIYATGVRNAYDLIRDNNGHLYAPTNGSAAGGNIPATPAGVTPAAPAENGVGQAEDDYLYDIVQGGYYGHPDPARGQYIFGGGNPINPAPNDAIQTAYPLGTNPDPNYRGYAYDFGVHYSPDGSIEYTGNAFGGALNGALLITEYSGGKDVDVLRTGSNGQITGSEMGIAGFTGFEDPVDIIENPATGDLYVADLGTLSITLLTPISGGATISVSTPTLYFNAPVNGAASPTESFTITNTGTQPLAIPATGLSVSGTDGALFPFGNEPTLPALIAPGASITVGIVFNPGNSTLGLHTAVLQISSNDLVNPVVTVNLRGLTTAGLGGSSQPSLAAILNLYQIADNVGTTNAAQSYFTVPPATPNDEVTMQELEKAGTGPVTITPLAAFDANITPAAGIGYYTAGTADSRTQLFTLSSASSQSVNPSASGTTSFDPGSSVFGIYGSFDALLDSATGTARIVYSEDTLNTYSTAVPRLIRFYPLKNSAGAVVPNSFVFAIDDDGASPLYQYTDFVGIINNVKAAPAAPVIGTQNVSGTDNEAAPSPTRLVFSAVQSSNASAGSVVHSTSDLRIDNSGSLPLVISSIASSNSFFTLALTYPVTIAAGGSLDVTVTYKPTHTGASALDSGTLTINSNDPVQPALAVQLAGIWQAATAPTLSQIVSTLGYTALGNETLSAYWTTADGNRPVTVEQLAAYSGKATGSTLYWYSQGHSSSDNSILSIPGDDTQSLLPLSNDKTGAPAIGSFRTTSVFGFSIDKTEFSDDTLNAHGSATDTGHHLKLYALYNAAGVLVPNTYLMVMSYTSSSEPYAYTDNVYLVSNVRPAPPALPAAVTAVGNTSGNTFSWAADSDPLVVGYLAYRSTSSNTGYVELSSKAVVGTSFVDTTATPGVKYYYTVAAIDAFGTLSPFTSAVSATRTRNSVPPAAPVKLAAVPSSSAVTLTWSANTEADLAGYNIYRSNSATGTYFKLNASPLSSPTFIDNSSPVGVTSYYRVTAVNLSGIESAPAMVSATVEPAVTKSVVVDPE
jgi:glucose/arabinose dehydrogenase